MSTAKSMATLYLNGKRNTCSLANKSGTLNTTTSHQRFKSSTSNLLAQPTNLRQPSNQSNHHQINTTQANKSRLKSTSMTNLVAGGGDQQTVDMQPAASRMQRPVSRNALDSIHNGMNAKYAQVQSKVYLQNIKPSSKIPSSSSKQLSSLEPASGKSQSTAAAAAASSGKSKLAPKSTAAGERAQLMAKLRTLEEELGERERASESLRHELEREKNEKAEQVQQLKVELQEKLAEHDRANEEYHKKLLEAYELADQNRRAADSVLSESRQRDEESRKKIEELESQLQELKEFVSMKEEMVGKMSELREQLRQERERYEEQLKSLHQVFENEKISRRELVRPIIGHQNTGKAFAVDENSNSLYFQRLKPNLESSESIDKQEQEEEGGDRKTGGCRHCRSGSPRQLHKSEQDIYGSKMSTRMHDTARSAWKASRKFASSVITGGVGLSSCRQCTKRTGTSSPPPPPSRVAHQLGPLELAGSGCAESDAARHTSVIQVGSIGGAETVVTTTTTTTPPPRHRPAALRQQQPSGQQQPPATSGELGQPSSLIKVDENNKLTIVTKFANDSPAESAAGSPPEMGASSSVSERSRCESSSSGRGTSSDAGSAASQNGDDDHAAPTLKAPLAGAATTEPAQGTTKSASKGHRRRSSLFKASKVFGGSQASLHKLKSLFATAKANPTSKQQQQQQQVASLDHLEASRLRCLELNQAINSSAAGNTFTAGEPVAELGGPDKEDNASARHETNNDEPAPEQQEIGPNKLGHETDPAGGHDDDDDGGDNLDQSSEGEPREATPDKEPQVADGAAPSQTVIRIASTVS